MNFENIRKSDFNKQLFQELRDSVLSSRFPGDFFDGKIKFSSANDRNFEDG